MSRARYDDAFGVVPLKWRRGQPSSDTGRVVLVEVWRAFTDIEFTEPTKPRISVSASLEFWVRRDDEWMVLGFRGAMVAAEPGEVRRHAFTDSRSWSATIALDGWGEL